MKPARNAESTDATARPGSLDALLSFLAANLPEQISEDGLDNLDGLAAASIYGPWHHANGTVSGPNHRAIADVWEAEGLTQNGEFIAAAREAVPLLVAEVRWWRARDMAERGTS